MGGRSMVEGAMREVQGGATIWGGGGEGPNGIVSDRKLMGDVIMRSGIKLLLEAGPNN
jgi:hypothetical protein